MMGKALISRLLASSCLLMILLLIPFRICAQTLLFTTDAEFARGTLLNVNTNAYPDQLQVNTDASPFPFIWIPASAHGTVVKIDVNTGQILGEYTTSPEGMAKNPSRTTVDFYGNVWVANRDEIEDDMGSVVKIGLIFGGTRGYPDPNDPTRFIPDPTGQYIRDPVYNQCVDRDGDGLIKTSSGYRDVLPWPLNTDWAGSPCDAGDPDALVQDAEDECILIYQRVNGLNARHLSLNPEHHLWVAGFTDIDFDLLDSDTGCILDSKTLACGSYGGFSDCNGVIWSSHPHISQLLRYDPATDTELCIDIAGSYGLGIDSQGFIWNSLPGADSVVKIDPTDGSIIFQVSVDPNSECAGVAGACAGGLGMTCPTGLAVRMLDDTVWTANRVCNYQGQGIDSVSRLDSNGTIMNVIPLRDPNTNDVGVKPTGVAIDGNGMVWVVSTDTRNVMRIDPEAGADGLGEVDLTVTLDPGAGPYNYSDNTGTIALSFPPFGSWSVVEEFPCNGVEWSVVTWNTETPLPLGAEHEPSGTSLSVEIRAAGTMAGLGREPFMEVSNGVSFGPLAGGVVEVRANLRIHQGYCDWTLTPVLTDLAVTGSLHSAEGGADMDICLGETVNLTGAPPASLVCTGEIWYRWSWPGNPGNWSQDPAMSDTPNTTTIYHFEVACGDSPECLYDDDVTVTVHNYPLVQASVPSPACIGNPIIIDASRSSCADCFTGLLYRFRLTDGRILQDWSPDSTYSFMSIKPETLTILLDVCCNDWPACWSTTQLSIIIEDCATPVRYAWYGAAKSEEGVVIQWMTLEEKDTLGFVIERLSGTVEEENQVLEGFIQARGAGVRYQAIDTEHAVSLLPDVRYRVTEMTTAGRGDLTPWFPVESKRQHRGINRSRSSGRN
ncbi:hypothetical protein ACFLU6_06475 [Acidobacteriota bacterium]